MYLFYLTTEITNKYEEKKHHDKFVILLRMSLKQSLHKNGLQKLK